ncbi:unnamed protein product, partial [Pylaiella littoralis]
QPLIGVRQGAQRRDMGRVPHEGHCVDGAAGSATCGDTARRRGGKWDRLRAITAAGHRCLHHRHRCRACSRYCHYRRRSCCCRSRVHRRSANDRRSPPRACCRRACR